MFQDQIAVFQDYIFFQDWIALVSLLDTQVDEKSSAPSYLAEAGIVYAED